MRRLLPHLANDVSPDVVYGYRRSRHPSGRPWVGVCMVASIDGSTVTDGQSGGLGNDTDRAVLRALRSAADVIIVGATTVRAEGYGPPRKAGQRIGVVTSSGRVDTSTELFTSSAGFLVMPEDGPSLPDHLEADCVRAGTGTVDLARAIAALDGDFVQVEGGATLNGACAAADLIDELNLTISPRLVGGNGPRITAGAPDMSREMDLVELLTDEHFLFGRWVRRGSA